MLENLFAKKFKMQHPQNFVLSKFPIDTVYGGGRKYRQVYSYPTQYSSDNLADHLMVQHAFN